MKKDKKLAEDLLKRRAAGEPSKSEPSPELLQLVSQFLDENEFMQTSRSLKTELQSRGKAAGNPIGEIPSLSKIYSEWRQTKDEVKAARTSSSTAPPTSGNKNAFKQKAKAGKQTSNVQEEESSSSASSSSDESSDGDSDVEMTEAPPVKKTSTRKASPSPSSSSDSSSSDSDADDEDEAPLAAKAPSLKPKNNVLKRKAASSSSESSSSDSSADSASEADIPKTKKAKLSSSSSESGSTSNSDSTSEDEAQKANKVETSSPSSSSSDSSSNSSSGSDSDSSTQSLAKKTPLPDSDSDSNSSDEESDSAQDKDQKPVLRSDTSATLSDGPKKSGSSLDSSSNDSVDESETGTNPSKTGTRKLSPPLPPTPVAQLPRKTNTPFSRIPKDTKVDPRLASNAYIPYDYAQKAHEDLIVTKGKGFTKEKNKKKRGSYKGGFIDVDGKKGIKFED